MNKKLEWGTKMIHGFSMKKLRPGRHCLTSIQVEDVRNKIDAGWPQSTIAEHYKVSRQTITNIKLGVGRFSDGAREPSKPSRINHIGTVTRFRAAVQFDAADKCWLYTGTRLPTGYGIVWSTTDGKRVYAHRYALELSDGRLAPEGMHACHKCDNPGCCNPAHIFWGTAADNLHDMITKGRQHSNFSGLLRHTKSEEHRRAVSQRIRNYNEKRVARHLFRGEQRTVAEIASALCLDRSAIQWRLRTWGRAEK